MKKTDEIRLHDLLDRIARIGSSGEWSDGLNPAQRAALSYLARANKFSRAPSNVADFLCTTRGTASQTLKALETKGLISQSRMSTDKRSISYDVTNDGHLALDTSNDLDLAIATLSSKDATVCLRTLEVIVRDMLKRRGFRSFGVCHTCRHHLRTSNGRTCNLLKVPLTDTAADELCNEHELKA